jgi:predicted NBD/HSP70 family sugar kinase
VHEVVEQQNEAEGETIAAHILSLVASGEARSRLELAEITGFSRSTIADRLSHLLEGGLISEHAQARPTRGRPTRRLELNPNCAVVLAADIGEAYTHLAVTDLGPNVLAESGGLIDIHGGPAPMLDWIMKEFERLLMKLRRTPRDVLGVGLGLPAQIDFASGRVVAPSLMTGWEDFDIREWFRGKIDAPIIVENEVNLMAVSEHRQFWPQISDLFFVKAGTGIGSGIIANGRIYRGARGAAGEIGHIQVDPADGPLCRCGMLGCVEARASGWALARDLRALGIPAGNARDLAALVKANRPEAIQRVREAGRILGRVVADIACLLNPAAIIIGGALARAEDHLMVGLRGLFYQRALPFAARGLILEVAKADPDTCVLLGAARVVIDAEFAAERVDRTLRRLRSAQSAPRRSVQVVDAPAR